MSDIKTLNKKDYKDYKTFEPFKMFVLQNFPFIAEDFDAMTYYQMLSKIVEYLNDVVDNNKLVQENENELVDAFNSLLHYFDNLEIQDEINNKLDEMTENGTLEEIMSSYLKTNAIFSFDTLEDLKNAKNLVAGSFAKTCGYNSYNDGNGYFYRIRKITNTDEVDNINIIAMLNNNLLVAERLYNNIINDPSNPIFYGADPTGATDSSDAINKCLLANINKQINFTAGKYIIDKPIEIPYDNEYGGINFNGAVLINNTVNDFAIGIGTKNHKLENANHKNLRMRFYNIDNLKLISNSVYGILIDRWFMDARFDNLDMWCYKNGIQIGKLYDGVENKPTDAQLSNFIIRCQNMDADYVAINIVGTDNKFNDGRIYGFKTGIDCNFNLAYLNNIHFLACLFNSKMNENYVAITNPNVIYIDNCYCDSYPVFLKYTRGNASIYVNNLFVYSWTKEMTTARIFDLSEAQNVNDSAPTIHVENVRIQGASYPNNMSFVYLGIEGKNTTPANAMKIFFAKSTFKNIRFADSINNENKDFDIAFSQNVPFTNNVWMEWLPNWVHIGNLIVANNTRALLKVVENGIGEHIFSITTNADGSISEIKKISGDNGNYNPAVAVKKIKDKCYKLYLARNKNDLSVTTCTQPTVSLTNLFVRILSINQDATIINCNNTTDVDLISI